MSGRARRLRQRGHDARPISLTGFGERAAEVTPHTDLETHIADIVAELDWRDYIVADERILAGKPIAKGTRLSVEFVLELLAAGWDREALAETYAGISR